MSQFRFKFLIFPMPDAMGVFITIFLIRGLIVLHVINFADMAEAADAMDSGFSLLHERN